MNDDIPLVDLTPQIDERWDQLESRVEDVMRSGYFINGPNVESFEEDVADRLGVDHAIGLNSGTDALVIGLEAMGVDPGDEVITTPFTFFATAEAIGQVGARPVFADIDPETFNLDPDSVRDQVTDDTAAILPVHLFGLPACMEALAEIARDHDVQILEDVAQAMGATYEGRPVGSFGDTAAFSFFPTKTLGAFGDGGLLATDDPEIAGQARKLRKHGGSNKYANEMLGHNSRLDELQAAILNVKLPNLAKRNEQRRQIADHYDDLLGDIGGVQTPARPNDRTHVFHQYTIRIRDGHRDAVKEDLADAGISTKVYYPNPLHTMAFLDASMPEDGVLNAERASREVLSLPSFPGLDPADQERVAAKIEGSLEERTN